ncbi:uncharacterized protein LOC111297512 [Durio zibethinus]|uniref:Uncharacterized protein LOC111297512 n=1 Tax=Durio zibethinus TaxID=66656 RepID=A0A6P5Z5T7_DURZI|nr:uncharacterized protein LOC111297512 [Durio zibethinus]
MPTLTKGHMMLIAFEATAYTKGQNVSMRFKGKTNLSHISLNLAHIPYWWVNNPTFGEFYFIMIGKANIEGSKSNVDMNDWLPQASYPYDDKAFGYLKKVIVTPAIFSYLVEFLHFDIQSTSTSFESTIYHLGKAIEGVVPSPSLG